MCQGDVAAAERLGMMFANVRSSLSQATSVRRHNCVDVLVDHKKCTVDFFANKFVYKIHTNQIKAEIQRKNTPMAE